MKRSVVIGSVIAFCVAVVLVFTAATATGVIKLANVNTLSATVLVALGTVAALGFILLLVGIGVYVYRDAKARGMEPVLWTIVAMLIPYFVGLVVYLIVRQSRARTCQQCGRGVPADAAFCPHCGASVQGACSACGRMVPSSAAYCPSCGAPLGEMRAERLDV